MQWDSSQDWDAPGCKEGLSISAFQSHTEAFRAHKMQKELEKVTSMYLIVSRKILSIMYSYVIKH